MANRDPIILACAADSGYALPLAVMLRSVGAHLGAGRIAEAYVLDDGILPQDRERILASLPANMRVHWCSPPALGGNLPLWGRMSITTYQKLTLGQWVPPDINRVLWLDCDMLVLADIDALWQTSVEGTVALAVQDQRVPLVSSRFGVGAWRELGLPRDAKHFNAGLLLIDLAAWRSLDVLSRSMAYLSDYGDRIYFWDQEALNAVLSGRWREIGASWNFHPALEHVHGIRIGEPGIVHFSGNLKPWRFAGANEHRVRYRSFLAQTAWAAEPLQREWRDGILEWYECSPLRRILYPAEQWATMAQRFFTRAGSANGQRKP
ncbi:MAG: glycosyltransferase family 8 protein [Acidobacteriota bacterium]